MKISYIAIGINIQAARKSLGLTQEQVAEILELSPNYYSQLERGVKKVSLTRAGGYCHSVQRPFGNAGGRSAYGE